MTLGNKLSKLRKENNITQEQLAEMLGVSRQSVSKWESDIAFPETEKLIRLSDIYNCTLDYLLKENSAETEPALSPVDAHSDGLTIHIGLGSFIFDKKSAKTLFGLPLWHICTDPKKTAKGIFALGFRAKGIVSAGFLSMGVISFGMLSLGALALGMASLGIVAAGAFSAGIIAFGAICFGLLSVGAVAIGEFSVGALARGHYFALGDDAKAMVAVGKSFADGSVYKFLGESNPAVLHHALRKLGEIVPWMYRWIVPLLRAFLG